MSFDGLNTLICLHFSVIDIIKFTSDVIPSFILNVLIPKFGAIFTNNSLKLLASISSDEVTVYVNIVNFH